MKYNTQMKNIIPCLFLELAWGVIANAGHRQGGWETQDKEWVEAAERWRDTWHEMLSANAAAQRAFADADGCREDSQ